jgi:hypothetical protein
VLLCLEETGRPTIYRLIDPITKTIPPEKYELVYGLHAGFIVVQVAIVVAALWHMVRREWLGLRMVTWERKKLANAKQGRTREELVACVETGPALFVEVEMQDLAGSRR